MMTDRCPCLLLLSVLLTCTRPIWNGSRSHKLQPGASVLDVGSGSGILCAAFYEMVKDKDGKGKVVGIDHIEELVNFSIHNLKKSYSKEVEDGSIKIFHGDGRKGCA